MVHLDPLNFPTRIEAEFVSGTGHVGDISFRSGRRGLETGLIPVCIMLVGFSVDPAVLFILSEGGGTLRWEAG